MHVILLAMYSFKIIKNVLKINNSNGYALNMHMNTDGLREMDIDCSPWYTSSF